MAEEKLFRLPGTIEEEDECDRDLHMHDGDHQQQRPESPLLAQRSINGGGVGSGGGGSGGGHHSHHHHLHLPKNVTLLRVGTNASSIAGISRHDSSRSRYRAGPSRKLRRRAVLKSGECNVLQSRISRRSLRFLQDIFTTLVDTQWRWTLLCFALSFILSWLVFASIWYLIAFTHGDFDPRHLADESWQPCVSELHSFTSCFLFSIETQHTIGYGGRSTTEECPEAIFVMCVQSISGVMIQALMVGIVFAKMSRPKQRTQTLLFSKQAVICQRDGELCLMFRVGDMRKSHIIGATVRAQLIRSRTTREGELLPHNQVELAVGADGQEENLFFIWPCTVVHRINSSSPFYNMSAEDMLSERFEIVVILEGTIESTGQTTQARSSYLPQEVLWGHRFEPIVSYSKERQGYEVDYSRFNSTLQVDTPLCSGRELAEFYRLQDGLRRHNSSGFLLDAEDLAMSPESPTTPCERLTQHERQLSIDSSCTGVATSRGAPSVPPAYYATKLRRGDEDSRSVCSLNGSRRTLASCAAPRSLTASKNCLRQLSSEANYGNFNDSSSLPGELSRIARNCCPIETVKPARLHDVLVSRLEQKQRMQQLAATSSRNGSQRCLHSHHQQQVSARVTHCSETRDNSSSESEPSPVRQEQQPLLVVQDADVPRSNRPILQLQMPAPPCMLPTSV